MPTRIARLLLPLGLALLLTACSSAPRVSAPVDPDHPVRFALLQQYAHWEGTPYRYGGNSRRGVDCSGFIQQVYRGFADRHLPRTTRQQAELGRAVSWSELEPGDLVFFKTGFKQRHAGIYLGNGEFMHASTSRGVILSRLDNPYWADAWWMARRLP